MSLSDKQYYRVARWLDGQPLGLCEAERAVAEEIRRGQQALGEMLDAPVPRRAKDRARLLVLAELARRQRLVRRFAWAAGAVAAAVILAVAVAVLVPGRVSLPPAGPLDVSAEQIASLYAQTGQDVDLDVISAELDELEAEIRLSGWSMALDAQIDSLQRSVDGFWLEDGLSWPDGI